MELKDIAEIMNGDNCKERFKAEYYQLDTRYRDLESMPVKWGEETINFDLTCPISAYDIQIKTMADIMSQFLKQE